MSYCFVFILEDSVTFLKNFVLHTSGIFSNFGLIQENGVLSKNKLQHINEKQMKKN